MFGWLKRSKQKQESHPRASHALDQYIDILNQYPNHIIDLLRLPADKSTMIGLLKILLIAPEMQNRPEMIKQTEDLWLQLSLFQTGVGDEPITFDILSDNPTVGEWRKRKERVEKWLVVASAEREKHEIEISEFRRLY